jgi:hypothetical protein
MKLKLLPLALALVLCLGLFSGCQSSALRSYSDDQSDEDAAASSETSSTAKDYTPVYASFAPDEVMLTINGIDVTWGELFYWYEYDVSAIESYSGDITDWDADSTLAEGKTYREYVTESALDTLKHYYALESKAKELGVTLSDEDKQTLQTIWQNNVDSYGGGDEAAFIDYLEKAFLTKALYDHINEISMLYDRVLAELFGASGEKLDAAEVVTKAQDLGYARAKHILIKTTDDTGAALPAEQIAEKKAAAEGLLAELKGITDTAALETRFDELVAERGEDPGTTYYTDGYTFREGANSLDKAFEAAALDLNEYGLSGIVETAFGYHILLRLPLKADAAIEYTSETEKATLAYYVAQELFVSETDNWAEESEVKFSDAYNKMDIAELFAKAVRPAA